jgi:hypothetical protein
MAAVSHPWTNARARSASLASALPSPRRVIYSPARTSVPDGGGDRW